MTASEAAVRFRDVHKVYGETAVLADVDLELPARRTTAIVGESGSGKSTLLRLINGLVEPDHGEVQVLGQRVAEADLTALRRRIGYAVQGGALFPHLDVLTNVTLLARLEGWPPHRRRERFEHLLGLMDLDPAFASRHPHELSGGQQQRVSLCRAMMLAPPVLLLDEPFSAVDPITRTGIHDHFRGLTSAEPVTVVLVTHDMREAVDLAGHLVVLGRGRVAQAGPTSEVLARPAEPWIERLFAEQLR